MKLGANTYFSPSLEPFQWSWLAEGLVVIDFMVNLLFCEEKLKSAFVTVIN